MSRITNGGSSVEFGEKTVEMDRGKGLVMGCFLDFRILENLASGSTAMTDTLATQRKFHSVSTSPCLLDPKPES